MIGRIIASQFVRFLFVGTMTLLFDAFVTTILYRLVQLAPGLSSAIGFVSGFAINFFGNRGIVFKSSNNFLLSKKMQILSYIALVLFNLSTSSLLIEFLVSRFDMNITILKIVFGAIIALWNFIIYKVFIFRCVDSYLKSNN